MSSRLAVPLAVLGAVALCTASSVTLGNDALQRSAIPLREGGCLSRAAVHDTDLERNRHAIDRAVRQRALCIGVHDFAEQGLLWRVLTLDAGRPGPAWILVHDDEDTAFDAALHGLTRYGGRVVAIRLRGVTRSRPPPDPNHNFAQTTAQRSTCPAPDEPPAPRYSAAVVSALGAPPYLALHNNADGHAEAGGRGNLSLDRAKPPLSPLPAFRRGPARLADADNLVLLAGTAPRRRMPEPLRQLTDRLRNAGVNVVYERVRPGRSDCSLSNHLLLHAGVAPGDYFNLEAEDGDLASQTAMIDALMPLLETRPGQAGRSADEARQPGHQE